jgi:7-keto-8-aminopelargonate synthetase-like enzyme
MRKYIQFSEYVNNFSAFFCIKSKKETIFHKNVVNMPNLRGVGRCRGAKKRKPGEDRADAPYSPGLGHCAPMVWTL